ncbi:DUF2357 domain-containing protein [Deinococcus sp. AJ005]|uniref:DUF2357 domain-containing protein n=1 Tax=Deinococcus sp. AJ005 TaxID=2652443 RepID=UPI0018657806|nr:DUF2357 domain-containing protein [Deinococcus sp. AJ005]
MFNRVSRRSESLPERLVGGLWQTGSAGRLNGLPAPVGTPLVPDLRGQVTWQPEGHEADGTAPGRFPAGASEHLKLGSLEDALTTLLDDGGDWTRWAGLSPMDRNLADDLQRLPLEEEMARHLAHLEAVCRQPRTHLEIFEERQQVSRARQIPTRAITYLASHTEDWENRSLRSVRPRRIIANVRDEQYDIYENRVAVRLVDHLLLYVRRRIARVSELLHTLGVVDTNAHEPPSGMYWRQRRLYSLWGDALDVTEGQLLAEERLQELQRLRRQLERLQGSLLYRQVQRRLQVPAQLRITNILGNDPHYRRVARLWLAWYQHAHTGLPSAEQQQRDAQEQSRLFDGYALLLTVQALVQFGFTPLHGDSTLLVPGTRLDLSGPEGEISLEVDPDGTHALYRHHESVLRVVPLSTSLSALERSEQSWVAEELAQLAQDAPTFTLLLYPGGGGAAPAPEFLALGTEAAALHPSLGCLPGSPVDLESTERVARALRWALTGGRYLAYPPRIPLPEPLHGLGAPPPFLGGSREWALPLPLVPSDTGWRDPARALRTELTLAERTLAELKAAGHQTRTVEREAIRLRQVLTAWETLEREVLTAETALESLRHCPICSSQGADLQAWDHAQFRCECGDCGAVWSVRRCPVCRIRHPWLRPRLRAVPVIDPLPGWADRLFGRDVLTLPDPHDLTDETCPRCTELMPEKQQAGVMG